MSANNDTISKTLLVTISLCVICAVFVSAAAVGLKPAQLANKSLDLKKNILAAAAISDPSKSIEQLFEENVTARVVNLDTQTWNDELDPATYDMRKASKDPKLSIALSPEEDQATIKRQARNMTVYMVKKGDKIEKLILPVHGYGLWSTLYGFLALESDFNTVVGLGFYEQAETPGLGGEVDNPLWKALWPGKKIYPEGSDAPAIKLIKGKVDPASAQAPYQVDGLAGASLTSKGVTNLLQFWMGENGYAPFLAKLRKGEV